MSSFFARVRKFSARHRILVVAVWMLLIAALGGIVATVLSSDTSTVFAPRSQAAETLKTVS